MGNFLSFKPSDEPKKPNKYLTGDLSQYAFETQEDFMTALADPRYESEPDFREAVAIMRGQSDFGDLTSNAAKAAERKAQWLRDEDHQIAQEAAQALFNTDLYRTSAAERRRVRDLIAANQANIEKTLPETRNGPSVKKFRLQLSEADMLEARKLVDEEKQAEREKNRKEAIEQAIRDAERPYIDVTGMHTEDDE